MIRRLLKLWRGVPDHAMRDTRLTRVGMAADVRESTGLAVEHLAEWDREYRHWREREDA